MDEREADRGDQYGALVGWAHENLGDRVVIRLQSTRKPNLAADEKVDEFRYFMTKNQAVVLANYLYSVSDRLPRPKRKWRWFR